jgi:hypothetical protein
MGGGRNGGDLSSNVCDSRVCCVYKRHSVHFDLVAHAFFDLR